MAFPFARVIVEYVVEGGTKVTWFFDHHFVDPTPHTFQLQVAKTSAPTADDWTDVGTEVVDTFYATDGDKRVYGKSLETHYRVKLTTSKDIYYSEPASIVSWQTGRDWLEVRELYRQYKKTLEKFKGTPGYLLKRRRFGAKCPTCLDEVVEQTTRDDCPTCYGTEIDKGYYAPVPDFYVDLGVHAAREKVDTQVRGTVKDVIVPGFCAADTLVNSLDLFVEAKSDRRWNIETVKVESEYKSYPICLQLELRQLPFSNIAYTIPLE